MRSRPIQFATLVTLALGGCAGGPTSLGPIEDLPRDLEPQEAAVIEAANEFAFDLFGTLARATPDSNVFVSPLSVSMALGMAVNGAEGETYRQMVETLGLSALTLEEINASYRGVIDLLLDLDPAVETNVANSVWLRRGFPVEESFLEDNRRFFDATIDTLDFTSPTAVAAINDWVREETRERIPTIIDGIPDHYILFLINAVYFKGLWTEPFDPDLTREEPFRLRGGSTRTVPMMMHPDSRFPYTATETYQAVELPYGGEAFAMTIVVPREGRTLEEVVAGLDAAAWRALVDGLEEGRVGVGLPRFRLEYEKTLNDALKSLGMEIAFTGGAADFSKISREFGQDLFIDEVKHKTFVEVDEEGTEAAAATSVGVGIVSMPPQVVADRPFLFVIRERLTGTILFIGQLVEPPR
jgi:serine protease inhibitor